MKILIVVESYLPKFCGMTSVTRYLAEGLVRKGHEVTIATQSHFADDKMEETINGVFIKRSAIDRSLLKTPVGDLSTFVDYVISCPKDAIVVECLGSLTFDIPYSLHE